MYKPKAQIYAGENWLVMAWFKEYLNMSLNLIIFIKEERKFGTVFWGNFEQTFERANVNHVGRMTYVNWSPWSLESNGESFKSFGVT